MEPRIFPFSFPPPFMPRKKATSKRRIKGTGSRFWSAKRKAWIGRKIVGRLPSGCPKYAQRTAATAGELERKLAEVGPPADGILLSAWLDRWLSEATCKPSTMRNRRAAVKHHLAPSLGHLRVDELTPRQVELASARWRLGSANTKRQVVAILGTAMRDAVRAGIRTDNPVQAARKPKSVKKKLDPFTASELVAICRAAVALPHNRMFALLAVTGMRIGEALALDVPDVCLDPFAISITKTYDSHTRTSGTPKSANGVRTIRVPSDPPEALAAVRAAIGTRTSGPLFRSGTGARYSYHPADTNWRVSLRRLGIRVRGFHQCRHSTISLMLAAGVPVAEVAAFHGNTAAEVMRTYAHATNVVDPAGVLEGVFRATRR